MSLFRTLLNSLTGAADKSGGGSGGPLNADLQKLDARFPGLARKLQDYIDFGGDPAVLATVGAAGSWLLGGRHAHPRDDPGVVARREAFSSDMADPAWVARYVEVLTADCRNARPHYTFLPASEAPAEVRVFLSELKNRTARPTQPGVPATPWPILSAPHVMEIVTQLGGRAEDVLDVVFHRDSGYAYRFEGLQLARIFDLEALVLAHPDAFVAVEKRLPVAGRAQLYSYLLQKKLVDTAPFDQMIVAGLGDSAKAIRETALLAFAKVDPARRLATADRLLATGNADMRGSMIEVLMALGSEAARKRLVAHLAVEKTARLKATIEGYLQATGAEPTPGTATDSPGVPGYRAIDGSFVAIPPLQPLPATEPFVVPDALRAELLAMGTRLEEKYQRDAASPKPPYYVKHAAALAPGDFVEAAECVVRGQKLDRNEALKEARRRIHSAEFRTWLSAQRSTLPPALAMDLRLADLANGLLPGYSSTHGRGVVEITSRIVGDAAEFDLRHLEARLAQANIRSLIPGPDHDTRPRRSGELLYALFLEFGQDRYSTNSHLDGLPMQAVWPLLAENLWMVDCALGLVADTHIGERRLGALKMLAALPKLPAKYSALLLDLAMTAQKDLRKAAAAILKRNQGYEAQLLSLLGDSRQDLRAGAAKWLGELGHVPAIAPLKKQLKAEKSVVVKSAILSALKALGEDVSPYIGPDALLTEAKAGLPKANFKDVDWLDLNGLPQVRYQGGTPVPAEVVRWWIALAVRLKTPADTGIFDLYLDQLDPGDAVRLSTWLFDAWMAHDIAPPSQAEAEAYAQASLARAKQWWGKHFEARRDWTDDQMLAQLRRDKLSETPNSAAAAKGLLSLGGRVPSTHAVARVRSYMRKHGGRTSQVLSLLELMAARGDAMSLQVVIAAATRLRQKGVQAKAAEMVQAIADRNDWTLEQLADRTVPTGGLDDDGTLDLPCAGGDKVYVARLADDLTLALFNPEGKPVKALPAGQDEETQASAKALAAARKEIKQAVGFQTARLFEAMCCGRTWAVADWMRDFHGHPLMRKLVERLIWQGLDASGAALASFRPTPEGDFIDTNDADVTLHGFAALRLAHASTLTVAEAAAWRAHLKDFSVTQIFEQVRQDLPRLSETQRDQTDIDDRMGWVYDTFTLRGEATRAGWDRGDALDGGGFDCYTRHFSSVGIVAVIEFSGNNVEQENVPAALKTLFFERLAAGQSRGYGSGQKLKLGQIPPVLLAETHADLHRIARKASFDPNWEKVSPW